MKCLNKYFAIPGNFIALETADMHYIPIIKCIREIKIKLYLERCLYS
jgi:hypothetical protein